MGSSVSKKLKRKRLISNIDQFQPQVFFQQASTEAHGLGISVITSSGDGKYFITGSNDKTIKVWTSLQNAEFQLVHTENVSRFDWLLGPEIVQFNGNDTRVYVTGQENFIDSKAIAIFKHEEGVLNFECDVRTSNSITYGNWIDSDRFLSSEKLIINNENVEVIWENCIATEKESFAGIQKCSLFATNQLMENVMVAKVGVRKTSEQELKTHIVWNNSNMIGFYEISESGKSEVQIEVKPASYQMRLSGTIIKALTLSPDKKQLYAVVEFKNNKYYISVIDLKNCSKNNVIFEIPYGWHPYSTFTMSEEFLVANSFNEKQRRLLLVWDRGTGNLVDQLPHRYDVISSCFNPLNVDTLITGSYNEIVIWIRNR